jgi:hypothetical protein
VEINSGFFLKYKEIPNSIHLLAIILIDNNMIKMFSLIFISVIITSFITQAAEENDKYEDITTKSELKEGFFNFYWQEAEGKIFLEIQEWENEFLYVSFLAAGVGSNDIGLDRGQAGDTKIVRFERYGPKVLLIQTNYDYRAESDNPDEQKSIQEAFAQSVIGGFKVAAEKDGKVLVDLSDFIVRDAHGVANILKRSGQGSYSLDKEKSVIYPENTKNFQFNSEFEALLTFSGSPTGRYIREVVPSPELVTVRQRHSFVALPDDNYQKRAFDPRAGYFGIHYMDYATPIEQDIHKRYISRHRLQKKNPKRAMSEAIEPIIYYVDRGAPEPIRSALIEGASWWNEAFEAAGFKDAFQVELLPEGADPLDVRYNVIQWVHRSTRGWSYGASIRDPRTGEIIKGHVSLGSLRVRQDFLIAQGLLTPYEEGKPASEEMTKMALARLRQLSAHEVGHTIGLAHNYIASTYRGSVMDYPHPLIQLDDNGNIGLSEAYNTGIGEWDKVAIRYGYSEFDKKQNEKTELNQILIQGIEKDVVFLSDQDARPQGSAHPQAHLWDNGSDAADELKRIMMIRSKALANFSDKNIPIGAPMSSLEEVLVPVYFLHRYQTEAAAKIIGGLEYNYAIRGDGTTSTNLVDPELQAKSLDAILETIDPDNLVLDEKIIRMIPPKPMNYGRGRENVNGHTGLTFDPLAFAETSSQMTLELLLNPQKCARMVEFHARDEHQPALESLYQKIYDFVFDEAVEGELKKEIQFLTRDIFINQLIELASNENTSGSVRAKTRSFLMEIIKKRPAFPDLYFMTKITKFLDEPITIKPSKQLTPPDGSPIGMFQENADFFERQCASFH